MDKKHALLLAFLITTLIAGNYFFFVEAGVSRESVEITRVLDGDTVELDDGRKVRLANINTPEKGLAYSELARNYLEEFVGKNLEMENLGGDKYGRTLGRLYFDDKYINLEIVRQGFAHTYLVFEDEEREFARAEEYAHDRELGIWESPEYADCISATINKYDEYVVVYDSCDLDLKEWTIKDESTKTYRIDEDAGSELTIYSGEGEDSTNVRYWGKKKIWNDDKDRIFIRDSSGLLVFYDSYS